MFVKENPDKKKKKKKKETLKEKVFSMSFLYNCRVRVWSLHFRTDYFHPFSVFLSIFFFGSEGYRSTYFYPYNFLVKVFGSQRLGVY